MRCDGRVAVEDDLPGRPLLPPIQQQSSPWSGSFRSTPLDGSPPTLRGPSKTPCSAGPSLSTHQLPCPLLQDPTTFCSQHMKNFSPWYLYIALFGWTLPASPPPVCKPLRDRACLPSSETASHPLAAAAGLKRLPGPLLRISGRLPRRFPRPLWPDPTVLMTWFTRSRTRKHISE